MAVAPKKYNEQPDNAAGQGKHDRFEEELEKNKILFGPQGFLNANNMGPFLHRNKHNIGYPETAHNNGEDPDEKTCNLQHRKKLVQLVIDQAGLVQGKIVLLGGFQPPVGAQQLPYLQSKLLHSHASSGLHPDLGIGHTPPDINEILIKAAGAKSPLHPGSKPLKVPFPSFSSTPMTRTFHPKDLNVFPHRIAPSNSSWAIVNANDHHISSGLCFQGVEIPSLLQLKGPDILKSAR